MQLLNIYHCSSFSTDNLFVSRFYVAKEIADHPKQMFTRRIPVGVIHCHLFALLRPMKRFSPSPQWRIKFFKPINNLMKYVPNLIVFIYISIKQITNLPLLNTVPDYMALFNHPWYFSDDFALMIIWRIIKRLIHMFSFSRFVYYDFRKK